MLQCLKISAVEEVVVVQAVAQRVEGNLLYSELRQREDEEEEARVISEVEDEEAVAEAQVVSLEAGGAVEVSVVDNMLKSMSSVMNNIDYVE